MLAALFNGRSIICQLSCFQCCSSVHVYGIHCAAPDRAPRNDQVEAQTSQRLPAVTKRAIATGEQGYTWLQAAACMALRTARLYVK